MIAAENGVQAIEKLKQEPFDLVLMDVQMPLMDGLECTARIRSGEVPDADIPIIAMTAQAMSGDRELCLAAGMNDHERLRSQTAAGRGSLLGHTARRFA